VGVDGSAFGLAQDCFIFRLLSCHGNLNVKIKINCKGGGQEYPPYTAR